MLEPMQFAYEGATSYATVTEFLDKEMHRLYALSFLLTADHDKAEQCLVSAMAECVDGIGVFVDWACSWTRRAVIKHAIQLIMPAPEHADNPSSISIMGPAVSAENNPFASILSLGSFERFVFVISILEGHSDEECAVLLGCSQRDVMMARVLALQRQSTTDSQAEEILQS
jgi:hypothetical protein